MGGRHTPPFVEAPTAPCFGARRAWLERVLEATQTLTVVLAAAALAHVVAVVEEVLVLRAVAIVLRGRPQVGVAALIVEIAIVAPVTGGEHREAILVGTVTAIVPATGGFQQRTSGAGTSDVGVQSAVLLVRGHMPAFWANAAVGAIGGTGLAIATPGSSIYTELGSTIHHGTPGIKATVLVAVGSLVFVAPAGGIGSVTAVIVLHASVCVVQVLGHPSLGADGYGFVHLTVAGIGK